jgi:uncharacterized protein (DUF1778 family)
MYEKDKNQRITLRLTEKQFNFVKANADLLDVSPSDFLRMVINSTMVVTEQTTITAKEHENGQLEISLKGTVAGRENDETNQHNIV